MPELPEVETIARQLRNRGVEGREILSAEVAWPRMVELGEHDRVVLELSGRLVLHYRDTRKFGRWKLVVAQQGSTFSPVCQPALT